MKTLAILITGGCGFIGSNLAARLVEDGHRVAISDWFGTTDKWRNIAAIALMDIALPDHLTDMIARLDLDVIIHMGAISATTERDVDLIVRTNVELSRQLLDHCTRSGVRFIYASSAATYGDGVRGFDDDPLLAALARLRALNAYGWSKGLFDQIVARRLEESRPMPPQCVGLKFFNVYGRNEHHKGDMRSVAAKIFEQVAAHETVTLFESHRADIPHGGQLRDFITVRDCVDVVAWLLDHPEVSGLFNVGTGKARTFLDLARAVFAALGIEPDIAFKPMPESLRSSYQYFTEARMGRLRRAGYVAPFTALEDGVRDYVHHLRGDRDRASRVEPS